MTKDEALKLALEAWQTSVYGSESHHKAMLLAMTNMAQAIAAQPEPVQPDWKAEYLKSVESGCITLDELREARAELAAIKQALAAPTVQEPVAWPRPEDQPIDNGPDCEDGPDEEGFSGPRPWNSFAQPAPVQEPESFEQWNAKQHGDPEEIGFLQALRIAYCSGQDSVTKATQPAAQRQWKGLTDEDWKELHLNTNAHTYGQAIEAKLKEKNNG
jgi:hypothetical protein